MGKKRAKVRKNEAKIALFDPISEIFSVVFFEVTTGYRNPSSTKP